MLRIESCLPLHTQTAEAEGLLRFHPRVSVLTVLICTFRAAVAQVLEQVAYQSEGQRTDSRFLRSKCQSILWQDPEPRAAHSTSMEV